MTNEMNDCPSTCPNRRRDAAQGKAAAYLFALLCSGFLAFQCVAHERRNETTPVLIWMPCLLFIGTALGVNIDPASLTAWLNHK